LVLNVAHNSVCAKLGTSWLAPQQLHCSHVSGKNFALRPAVETLLLELQGLK